MSTAQTIGRFLVRIPLPRWHLIPLPTWREDDPRDLREHLRDIAWRSALEKRLKVAAVAAVAFGIGVAVGVLL